MTNHKDLIEPSDIERGGWLDATVAYVDGLEGIIEARTEQLWIATRVLDRIAKNESKFAGSYGIAVKQAEYTLAKMKEKDK